MVICKYFLRGACRFGENCKNEHSYNDNTSAMRKKTDMDPNVLIKAVSNDMDKAEKGNQWPLSCYGPFQGKPCFPGFEDKCFEEIRLGIYEAQKNGTIEQYKQHLTQLLHEARMKMRSLLTPTPEATHVLQELYNANTTEAQNTNVFANTNTFGNNPQQHSSSIFGNTNKNIFNNQTTTTPANNFAFAVPENKSIFGNSNQSQPNTGSIFGSPTVQQNFPTGGNIFGNAATPNVFATAAQSSNNLFQNANTATYSQSIFGKSLASANQSPFGPQRTQANLFSPNNQPPPNPFKQNTTQSPFGAPNQSPFGPATTNQSIFGSPTPNPSPFGSSTSQAAFVSTGNAQTPFGGAIVSQATFATPNQTPFGGNIPPSQPPFGSTSQTSFVSNQSAFNTPSQSPFASVTSSQTSFNTNQSPFGSAAVPTENRSIFAQQNIQPQSTFGQNTQSLASDHSYSIFGSNQTTVIAKVTARVEDPTVYSKIHDLSENDVKSFEGTLFEFRKIPDNPPALQMCS